MKRFVAITACVALLGGCVTDGQLTKENLGTGLGAVVGGLAGSTFGSGSGRIVAVVAGAAVGAFVGNRIGAMLDEQDRAAVDAKAKEALLSQPDNAPVNWTSERSGATATIIPENTRTESRKVNVVRDAKVAPAGQLDLIGARYRAKTNANIRLAPSQDADKVQTLPTGAPIWAVGKVAGKPWIMVAQKGKSVGYISADLIEPEPKVAAVPASTKTSTQIQASAAYDLDADAAPIRAPADLDALAAGETKDVVEANVTCRDLKTTATAKGETSTTKQTACRSPDGSWELG